MTPDVLTIMGTRPQYIKCSVLRLAYEEAGLNEVLVDTGQHYDDNMSSIFFEQLGVRPANYRFSTGGKSHSLMIGSMLVELEKLIVDIKPKSIAVIGDTNSTLAGALVSSRMGIPFMHIEAGLRSFDKSMPEEQNRIVADHLADFLACPTVGALKNLSKENITKNVFFTGDVMFDAVIHFQDKFIRPKELPLNIKDGMFNLLTLHRSEALKDKNSFFSRIQFVRENCNQLPTVFVIHPHTKNRISEWGINLDEWVLLAPQPYFEMQWLLKNAGYVFTDSGGVQKEAFFHKKSCITLRSSTEWPETLSIGNNSLWNSSDKPVDFVEHPFGSADAARKIATLMSELI